jgi:hypothetical protein
MTKLLDVNTEANTTVGSYYTLLGLSDVLVLSVFGQLVVFSAYICGNVSAEVVFFVLCDELFLLVLRGLLVLYLVGTVR